MLNKKCPKCGSILKKIKEHSAIAWICPTCGYGEATTIAEPIYNDEKIYSIVLGKNDPSDLNIIKVLSKFTGLNFLQTKELIKNPRIIFSGRAYELLERKVILDKNNIKCEIFPKLPY